MILQSCIIALIGISAVFGFLMILVWATALCSKIVQTLNRSNMAEIAAAVVFARHQKGE